MMSCRSAPAANRRRASAKVAAGSPSHSSALTAQQPGPELLRGHTGVRRARGELVHDARPADRRVAEVFRAAARGQPGDRHGEHAPCHVAGQLGYVRVAGRQPGQVTAGGHGVLVLVGLVEPAEHLRQAVQQARGGRLVQPAAFRRPADPRGHRWLEVLALRGGQHEGVRHVAQQQARDLARADLPRLLARDTAAVAGQDLSPEAGGVLRRPPPPRPPPGCAGNHRPPPRDRPR